MNVAIFGGGVAGLSTAIHLLDAGHSVTVYEKRSVLGGKVSVWKDRDGDSIESGLHVVFGGYKELQRLLQHIGAPNAIEWKDLALVYAEKDGRTTRFEKVKGLPSPLAELIGGLKTNVITLKDKLSLIKGLLPLILKGDETYFRSQDHLTYKEWHHQRGCTENSLQRLWRPISLALNFIEPDVISARPMVTIFNYFGRNYEDARFAFFKKNPGESMIEPMCHYIEKKGGIIKTNAKLGEWELNSDRSIQSVKLTSGEVIHADVYVSALPVHSLQRLLPPVWLELPYFSDLLKFEGSPVANLQLWFDRKVTDVNNLLFSQGTLYATFADVSLTCAEDYQPGQGTAKGGSVLSLVLAPAHQLMTRSTESIVEEVMSQLKEQFPLIREAKLLKHALVKIPQSVYKAVPGVDQFRPDQKSPVSNLFLAGDYTYQSYLASMEGAALSGKRAAEKICAHAALASKSGLTQEVVKI